MTDTSPKGPLPQLTDVLYLLTDSQELLLSKIQSVRVECARSTHSAAQRTPPTVNATPSAELELMSTDDNAAAAVREKPAPPSPSSKSPSLNGTGRVPVVTVLPRDDLTLSETTTETETQITAHADLAEPVPSVPTDSANRSYNFFDDLDKHLADLERPDTAS